MKAKIIYLCFMIFPLLYGEKCSHFIEEKNMTITCEEASIEDYLDNIFEMKINIRDLLQDNSTNIIIKLNNCNFSHVDEWIYLPWEECMEQVTTLNMINSSINHIRSLSRFRELETLDLSRNNITDYTFLNRMKKLSYLYLAYNSFTSNSFLFTHIKKQQTELRLIDLSYSNLRNFTIPNSNIKSYDLSYSENLTKIIFENSQADIRPYVNVSGNKNLSLIRNNLYENYYICLSSIDLSNSSGNLSSALKNVRISDSISLRNNYLPVLNETTFNITRLHFHWCSNLLGVSIDLSNVSLVNISVGFFNERSFNYLNLSFNNLSKLEHPLFINSNVVSLNLSSSNISSISSDVFKNLTVQTMDLSRNNIRSFDGILSQVFSIKEIILSFNPITVITKNAFKKCRDLEVVDLSNSYPVYSGNVFATLPSLRTLIFSFKKSLNTTEIHNMHVTNLTVVNSKLDRLNSSVFKGFYKLNQLTFINSSVSGLSDSVFKGLYSLKYIDIKGLNIPNFDMKILKPLSYLEVLNLSNYNLKKVNANLNGLLSLKVLNLSSNSLILEVDSFSSLKNLEILSLANNKMANIPVGLFAPLEKLTHLYLNKNSLQQLSAGTFSGLKNLEVLDLSNNGLYRTKLHILVSVSLEKMRYLYLQNNNLGSEYAHEDSNVRKNEFRLISTHASLKHIDINNNEWLCNTLIELLVIFRDKNISFSPEKPSYKTTNINGISCY